DRPPRPPRPTLFPYTTLFRSLDQARQLRGLEALKSRPQADVGQVRSLRLHSHQALDGEGGGRLAPREKHLAREQGAVQRPIVERSEEHTSELQSRFDLVCRLL